MALPLFELLISPEEDSEFEVKFISGVDMPAIKANWFAFRAEQPEPLAFAFKDEARRIIFGPAMIPDQRIVRKDEKTGEAFEVFFSKETIAAIAEKFYQKNYQTNFNTMHNPDTATDGVVFFQSVIKNTEYGITGMAGDYPEGTWFLGAKVNDDKVWDKVKAGEIKGFSVEGLFGFKKQAMSTEQLFERIKEILLQ